MFDRAWYVYLLQILCGALLANGVPHFVKGVSGEPFQSPFAKPPGVGLSSPLVNVLWGLLNLVIGFILLARFWPKGSAADGQWTLIGLGALLISVQLARHFGRVRSGDAKR